MNEWMNEWMKEGRKERRKEGKKEGRRIFASPNRYLAETTRFMLLKIDAKVMSSYRKRNDKKMTMDIHIFVDFPKNTGAPNENIAQNT